MKVLLGIDTWYPKFDGVVIATENYCKYLNEGGESKVVVPDYKDKAEAAAHGEHAIFTKTLRLPIFKGYACPMPKFDAALEKEISDGGYDVLHAHSPFTIDICLIFEKESSSMKISGFIFNSSSMSSSNVRFSLLSVIFF